jgi:hypothetical protein
MSFNLKTVLSKRRFFNIAYITMSLIMSITQTIDHMPLPALILKVYVFVVELFPYGEKIGSCSINNGKDIVCAYM